MTRGHEELVGQGHDVVAGLPPVAFGDQADPLGGVSDQRDFGGVGPEHLSEQGGGVPRPAVPIRATTYPHCGWHLRPRRPTRPWPARAKGTPPHGRDRPIARPPASAGGTPRNPAGEATKVQESWPEYPFPEAANPLRLTRPTRPLRRNVGLPVEKLLEKPPTSDYTSLRDDPPTNDSTWEPPRCLKRSVSSVWWFRPC
jgi:hypothetical protein